MSVHLGQAQQLREGRTSISCLTNSVLFVCLFLSICTFGVLFCDEASLPGLKGWGSCSKYFIIPHLLVGLHLVNCCIFWLGHQATLLLIVRK
jgi:hypothetical protein